ncbi:MAG: alpha/beta hydrolase, partial [Myxococcales bacterium]|nr:alpha/beta hydrolase [Myxococcales bacterium]
MKDTLLRAAAKAALSGPLVRVLGRGAHEALDPQIAAVLALQKLMRLPALETMDPPRARRFAEAGLTPLDVPIAPMERVIDTSVARAGLAPRGTAAGSAELDAGAAGSIPVRIYVPFRAGPHWIVYLHGGGGVIGSIGASERFTRLLAATTGMTVASVGYRLGPEDKHPAAIEDACAAWDALVARVPRSGKAVVAGDSFGGFLAAHVDRYAMIRGTRQPDLQLLIYPIVDLTLTSPTIEQFGDGYLLTRSMMQWFRSQYLRDTDDRKVPSPAYWDDLTGAAPAVVATAGFDPLVAEGDHHADRLRRAGTLVRHRRYPGLIHGFISLAGGVSAARAAVDELCADVIEL